jgi:acyl-CoA synthetase (NDP forming)
MTDLSRLLQPRSVAYIGGSQIAGPIRAAKRAGFEGGLFAVNPTRASIEGVPCSPDVASLPEVPDAAVVGVSAERSVTVVEALAAIGCGGAVVMSSGFAELNNDEGRARQQRLVQAAGEMPLLGPNCMGMMNQFTGAFVWGDDNHCARQQGPAAAIISQSGALLIGMTGVETAFPLGYAISIGNQAVTSMADLIDAVLDDERIKAIGLYIEGINEGEKLGRACLRALQKRVPVVALKGGDQAAGASVAQSHTAAMVVERDLWNAFRHRHGLVEVTSPKALVETLKLLSIAGVAAGNRLSVVSYSGGINSLTATRCAEAGITLPMPLADNHQWLKMHLPESVAIANPLDLNIPYAAPEGNISMQDTRGVAQSIIRFAQGVSDQILFLIDVPRPGAGVLDEVWCDSLHALVEVRDTLGVPVSVAAILPGGLPQSFCTLMQQQGIACLQGYNEVMDAMLVSQQYLAHTQRISEPPRALLSIDPIGPTCLLDEAQSKQELTEYGLETTVFVATTPADALEAAKRIGYPVALKILSTEIAHKAQVGGVQLNLRNDVELAQALTELTTSVTAAGHSVEQLLVERMLQDCDEEVIIGVKRHAALGLALMIGRGGSAAEYQAEFETLLLPCTDEEIYSVLVKLNLHNHGASAALQGACRAVARYAQANLAVLSSLDVNPVMLTREGRAIAADALIVRQQ